MKINNRQIGQDHSPYIIAELGINHNGDIHIAHKMLEAAAQSGADAVKLQTFKTEKFISRSSDYFDLLKSMELSQEQVSALIAQANELGITIFSAVFDEESADFWDALDAPAYKIASGELTHLPLLRHIASKGRPMIMSTGGGTVEEVQTAVSAISQTAPGAELAILHCVSNYPTEPKDLNLSCMSALKEQFAKPVGFSDHTVGIAASIAATALGANIIEKHFTLDRSMTGPDHALSTTPDEFKGMVSGIRTAYDAIGDGHKKPVEAADFIPLIRRSVTADVDIAAGTVVTRDMLAFKRPGTGVAPDDIDKLVGKKAKRNIAIDDTMTWDLVEG